VFENLPNANYKDNPERLDETNNPEFGADQYGKTNDGHNVEIVNGVPVLTGDVLPRTTQSYRLKVGPDGPDWSTAQKSKGWIESPEELRQDISLEKDSQQAGPDSTYAKLNIDRERLNRLIVEGDDPSKIFGRDIVIEKEDVEAVGKVLDLAQNTIDRYINQFSDWQDMQDAIRQYIKVGGFKPRVIDGGENAPLELRYNPSGLGSLSVRTGLYRLYMWQDIVSDLRRLLAMAKSNDGISTTNLAKKLSQIAKFIKENQLQ
jgi:hypothetical protein